MDTDRESQFSDSWSGRYRQASEKAKLSICNDLDWETSVGTYIELSIDTDKVTYRNIYRYRYT